MNDKPLTFAEYQAARYFPALDGLRAISCLFVITWHADFLGWGVLNGHSGVTAFFVLSGYLITTLALREEARRGKLNIGAFYLRRSFRIFPAYYAVLILYCILIFGVDIQSSIDRRAPFTMALPYYLFYLNEYTSGPIFETFGTLPPFFHSWSLGVEEKFYLIWPFLAFVLLHRNPIGRVAVAAALLFVQYAFHNSALVALLKLNYYTAILLGCILAVLMEQEKCYRYLSKLATTPAHILLFCLMLAAQFLQTHEVPDIFDVLYPYAVALFLIGLVIGRSPCTRLFAFKPLAFLGLRTYGMYLLHLLVQNTVEVVLKPGSSVSIWASPFYFLACLIGTVIAAEVLYRTLEKPCIDIGHRLSKRVLDRAAAPGPNAP